jgi:hypothetical protein
MISALDQKAMLLRTEVAIRFGSSGLREFLESSTLTSVVNLQFTMEFKTPLPHSRRHKRIVRHRNISWNVAHEEALSPQAFTCHGYDNSQMARV